MKARIGLVAQGGMGAGIGGRLVERGHEVLTVLDGRSAASARRAADAGMTPVAWNEVVAVDIFLSVVPPGEAIALARTLAPHLRAVARAPIYLDLNAINAQTVQDVAAIVTATGATFADGGIFGGPPVPGKPSPVIYLSGPGAPALGHLQGSGLDIRVMDAPAGAASSLKICQSGLTKGYSALAAIMVRAAMRAGIGDALHEELNRSAPGLMGFLGPAADRMFDKAYRYVGEMDQIGAFVADEVGGRQVFEAFREVYAALAADRAGPNEEIDLICRFYTLEPPRLARGAGLPIEEQPGRRGKEER